MKERFSTHLTQKKKRAKRNPDVLTPAEDQFCHEFVVDFNGTQAYSRAFKNKNLNSCSVLSGRLLGKVKISKRIAELRRLLAERTLVTAEEVIRELKIVGLSKITDYGTFGPEGFKMFDSKEIDPEKLGAIQSIETETKTLSAFEGDSADDLADDFLPQDKRQDEKDAAARRSVILLGKTKFKLHPKEPALNDLGQYLGILKGDNKNVNVRVTVERTY